MKNKFLYWSPRILSIFFVIFLGLFCFDSFDKFDGWKSIIAVLIHLITPFIVLIGVIIAWKKDLVGAVFFCVLAIYYVFMVGFYRHWSWYISISGPALLIAILFFLNWQYNKNKSNI